MSVLIVNNGALQTGIQGMRTPVHTSSVRTRLGGSGVTPADSEAGSEANIQYTLGVKKMTPRQGGMPRLCPHAGGKPRCCQGPGNNILGFHFHCKCFSPMYICVYMIYVHISIITINQSCYLILLINYLHFAATDVCNRHLVVAWEVTYLTG